MREYFYVIAQSWKRGQGVKAVGFCCRNMLGTVLNFLLGMVKHMSCSAYRRAREEHGREERGEIILVQNLLTNQKPCQCYSDLSPSQWSRH